MSTYLCVFFEGTLTQRFLILSFFQSIWRFFLLYIFIPRFGIFAFRFICALLFLLRKASRELNDSVSHHWVCLSYWLSPPARPGLFKLYPYLSRYNPQALFSTLGVTLTLIPPIVFLCLCLPSSSSRSLVFSGTKRGWSKVKSPMCLSRFSEADHLLPSITIAWPRLHRRFPPRYL